MHGLALGSIGSIGSIGSRLQRLSMQKSLNPSCQICQHSGDILVKHGRISFVNFFHLAAGGDHLERHSLPFHTIESMLFRPVLKVLVFRGLEALSDSFVS